MGMRVLIDLQQDYEEFTENPIPIMSVSYNSDLAEEEYVVKGFQTNACEVFDQNDNTYISFVTNAPRIKSPVPIKPSEIKIKTSMRQELTYTIYGTDDAAYNWLNGVELVTGTTIGEDAAVMTYTNQIETNEYYHNFFIRVLTTIDTNVIHEMEITKGSIGMFNSALDTYINIGNLGNKLLSSKIETGKKYELIYDGTMFNVKELV